MAEINSSSVFPFDPSDSFSYEENDNSNFSSDPDYWLYCIDAPWKIDFTKLSKPQEDPTYNTEYIHKFFTRDHPRHELTYEYPHLKDVENIENNNHNNQNQNENIMQDIEDDNVNNENEPANIQDNITSTTRENSVNKPKGLRVNSSTKSLKNFAKPTQSANNKRSRALAALSPVASHRENIAHRNPPVIPSLKQEISQLVASLANNENENIINKQQTHTEAPLKRVKVIPELVKPVSNGQPTINSTNRNRVSLKPGLPEAARSRKSSVVSANQNGTHHTIVATTVTSTMQSDSTHNNGENNSAVDMLYRASNKQTKKEIIDEELEEMIKLQHQDVVNKQQAEQNNHKSYHNSNTNTIKSVTTATKSVKSSNPEVSKEEASHTNSDKNITVRRSASSKGISARKPPIPKFIPVRRNSQAKSIVHSNSVISTMHNVEHTDHTESTDNHEEITIENIEHKEEERDTEMNIDSIETVSVQEFVEPVSVVEPINLTTIPTSSSKSVLTHGKPSFISQLEDAVDENPIIVSQEPVLPAPTSIRSRLLPGTVRFTAATASSAIRANHNIANKNKRTSMAMQNNHTSTNTNNTSVNKTEEVVNNTTSTSTSTTNNNTSFNSSMLSPPRTKRRTSTNSSINNSGQVMKLFTPTGQPSSVYASPQLVNLLGLNKPTSRSKRDLYHIRHSAIDIKRWEGATGQNWWKMNSQDREFANTQITEWLKNN